MKSKTINTDSGDAAVWVVTILISIPLTIWSAFAVQVMWSWFITPTFGIAAPHLVYLMGILAIISHMTYTYVPDNNEKGAVEQAVNVVLLGILRPVLLLTTGAILRLFI